MAITNGLATLAEFKAFVTVRAGTITTDTADDAVMEDIIEKVSRYIENQSGRRFWVNTVDETRYYQADDAEEIDIDDFTSITTLWVDLYNTRTYTAVTLTDVEYYPANAATLGWPYNKICVLPDKTAYFPTTPRGVKVIGKFGFPAVPDNIKTDCLEVALNVWMSRQGQVSGGKMTVTASGIVIRPEDIPPSVQKDIEYYKDRL